MRPRILNAPEAERCRSQSKPLAEVDMTVVISLPMIFLVGSLSLILTDGTARAQSALSRTTTSATTAQIPTPSDPTKADRLTPSDKVRIAQYMAQCLNDWDAATHMTKPEWARVCRRVIDNRVKFLRETGFELPVPR
jgi:hypothetical protein